MAGTKTAAAGISDEQLEALIAGGWEDDGTDTPGWRRWVLVVDEISERRVLQWVFPSFGDHSWNVEVCPDDKMWVDGLDKALTRCDDWAGSRKIAAPEGAATKQEDRFVRRVSGG